MATDKEMNDFLESLEKARKVFDTNSSLEQSYGRGIKTKTEMLNEQLRADKKLLEQIKENAKIHGVMNIQDQVELDQLTARIKQNTKSLKVEEERIGRVSKAGDAAKKFGSSLGTLITSALVMNNSFNDSERAFTSVIPTIDTVSGVLKSLAEAAGLALSGVEILGESAGRLPESISKIAVAAIDLSTNVVKAQLEMSQAYVDEYKKLSIAGVTLGGQLGELASKSAKAGLNIKLYSEFVTRNVGSLKSMHGTMEQAATTITQMGHSISKNNKELVLMYGGIGGVDDALAGYSESMAQLGVSMSGDTKKLAVSAADYLHQQKLLSELTGESVTALKKQQDEAMKDIGFREKLAGMDADHRKAAMAKYTMVYSLYGKQAADLFKEKVALDGRVISQEGLRFSAMNQAVGGAIDQIRAVTDTKSTDLSVSIGKIVDSNEAQVQANIKNQLTVDNLARTGSEFAQKNAQAHLEQLDAQDKRVHAEKSALAAVADYNKKTDATGAAYVGLQNQMVENGQQIDKMVQDNLGTMASISSHLNDIQMKLFSAFGGDKFLGTISTITSGLDQLAKHLPGGGGAPLTTEIKEAVQSKTEQVRDTIGGTINSALNVVGLGVDDSELLAQRSGVQNEEAAIKAYWAKKHKEKEAGSKPPVPMKAEGGIVNSPSVAGEAGPEAVVPLANGRSIPVQIDMSEVTKKLDELIRVSKEHSRTSERILQVNA